jgi:glycosyltransferase involved in cell wall biosynthesis
MPLLTDINKFKPLQDPLRKRMLRTKYGIPHNHYVISHMGHINEGRNLESLIPMQSGERYVLVIESSSTPKDAAGPVRLREKLEAAGIRIMNKYLDNIEEIYQLSDLYVFPVTEKTGSIGLPLSILEARACGIPVLTTEFGGIRNMLGDDYGNIFYSQAEKFEEALQKIREHSGPEYGKTKVRELNSTFIKVITEQIEHSH